MTRTNYGLGDIKGLSNQEVTYARAKYGKNKIKEHKQNVVLAAIKGIMKEPMVVLLLVTSTIYFVSGDYGDGAFLAAAILLVAAISLFQDNRSRNALKQLEQLTQPVVKVIRNNEITAINSEDLVVGDYMIADEGTCLAADGYIYQCNDFTVNESIITGESMPAAKDTTTDNNKVYMGTTVASGLAVAVVTAIAHNTKLGMIGDSLNAIKEEKTPLELQIAGFVKTMVILGSIVFVIVWGLNYYHSRLLTDSLLKALTLAMSILPEEIPVAFSTFMALGAWRLMKLGIVVKQMKTVETLGSATVICTDKTGTITENKMSLVYVYSLAGNETLKYGEGESSNASEVIRMAMWSSEPLPFDPMEVALHEAYTSTHAADERSDYKMAHEYALDGKPPMMTHIFENEAGVKIVAAKGAPEALMAVSNLNTQQKANINTTIDHLAQQGYRLLGVGEAVYAANEYPATQQELKFSFKGIVAFYDPPKENIQAVLEGFYDAGIDVKIITGDNAKTTNAIAKQIGLRNYEKSITGSELMELSEPELRVTVAETQVYTRMFPEAKLRIINALKANGQVVAMTGDGVNDGPALKAAHIGIAMGKKGTEIAKQAASLILTEDDLSKMIDAIAMGRRIYANLKKAIQYIISIHIPIILTVFVPLALNWVYPNIFSPIHIIFLELIMGPTCSIIYENEPTEGNTMKVKPRLFSITFFNWRELTISIVQGLAITLGTLMVYQYAANEYAQENLTRTMVFGTLIAANIFLTLVNRSFYYSIVTTFGYKNNLVGIIILVTVVLSGLLIYVTPLASFFGFAPLSGMQVLLCASTGFVSVIWMEAVKWNTRRKNPIGSAAGAV